MSRLKSLTQSESPEERAEYFERTYSRVCKHNVDFAMRLAWYIAKADYGLARSLSEQQRLAEALPFAERARNFFSAHMEYLVSHRDKYKSLVDFKSDAQRKLLYSKILELLASLGDDAELENCDQHLEVGENE